MFATRIPLGLVIDLFSLGEHKVQNRRKIKKGRSVADRTRLQHENNRILKKRSFDTYHYFYTEKKLRTEIRENWYHVVAIKMHFG